VQIRFLHFDFFETIHQQAWKEWVEPKKDGDEKDRRVAKKRCGPNPCIIF
jgi:hypothetical protein